MAAPLTTTSYALLGLLVFDSGTESEGLTGYELKQRSDNTLRFYWVSPAMSQIYTELARLERSGMVVATDEVTAGRTTRRYRITTAGSRALTRWLHTATDEFPTLKHPVALRLLMGALMDPDAVDDLLRTYVDALRVRRAELQVVRDMLGDAEEFRFPALVADWGRAYYDAEESITLQLIDRVRRLGR